MRVEGRKNWTTWYVLPGQEYLLDVDAARIIAAVERLKPVLLRMPTVDEIAVEAGITLQEAESWRISWQLKSAGLTLRLSLSATQGSGWGKRWFVLQESETSM